MKKAIALLLVLILGISLAACGGNDDDATTTTEPITNTDGEVLDPSNADPSTSDSTDPSVSGATDPSTTEPSGANTTDANGNTSPVGTTNPGGNGGGSTTLSKKEVVDYYNKATVTFLNGRPGQTKIANTTLGAIKGSEGIDDLMAIKIPFVNQTVRQVVGAFIGEGKQDWSKKKGLADNDNILKSTLTANDAKSATRTESGSNYIVTINVIDQTDPAKGSGSAMGRFTQDFKTKQDVYTQLENEIGKIPGANVTFGNISFKYTNIKIVATIDKATGRFVKLVHSYDLYVRLQNISVKFLVKIGDYDWAEGNGKSTITCSNFTW